MRRVSRVTTMIEETDSHRFVVRLDILEPVSSSLYYLGQVSSIHV